MRGGKLVGSLLWGAVLLPMGGWACGGMARPGEGEAGETNPHDPVQAGSSGANSLQDKETSGETSSLSEPFGEGAGVDQEFLGASFVLPMEPKSDIVVETVLLPLSDDGTPIEINSPLVFAFDAEYPTELTVLLRDILLFGQEAGDPLGAATVAQALRIDDGSEELSLQVDEQGRLLIELLEPGLFHYAFSGTVLREDPLSTRGDIETQDFVLQIPIEVVVPSGLSFELASCFDDPAILPGRGAWGRQLFLLPEPAESSSLVGSRGFVPLNATAERPATIAIYADETARFEGPNDGQGVLAVGVQGPPQTLRLRSSWGDFADVDLIELGDIDQIEVDYHLWYGRDYEELTQGGSYEVSDFGLEPHVRALRGGIPICTQPERSEYEYVSLSNEVCAPSGTVFDTLGPGECDILVKAPEFNRGAGLEDALTIQLTERSEP